MRGLSALVVLALLPGCGSQDSTGGPDGDTGADDGGLDDAGQDGGADAGNGGRFDDDELLPWEGGPAYWERWKNGPSADPSYFPIAVWLQSPANAEELAALGVNLFIGLWDGPTEEQLTSLDDAGMPVIADQNAVGLAHLDDPTLVAWMHGDEPDNAQPAEGGGYDPCVPPANIVQDYETMIAADATRPVYLNLGRGVADTDWIGRGECTGDTDMYSEYAEGADILSFDIYPVNSTEADVAGNLWYVADGVDNLREWSGYEKPVWNWLECTKIGSVRRPTPLEVRAEAWMSLVHGARGIGWFVHEFEPFQEAGILDDAEMSAAVLAIDTEITELAPALNRPTVANGATVSSSNVEVPVDFALKRDGETTYLFAVAMRDGSATATFTLRDFPQSATAEVIGEDRELTVTDGSLVDDFDAWEVHLYRIAL